MNMKRAVASFLTLAMTLSLAACGSSSEQSASGGEAAKPAAEKIVIQVAHENNPGEPVFVAGEEWQRLVAEKSGGTMEIELFPSSQLGSKTDLIDQIIMGEPIITICDGSFLAEYGAPEMAIVSAPYVFESWDQCWKLLDSDWWQEESALLEENGIHIVTANWMFGERNIMTTKPVRTFEDMKGMILRTPNTPSYMKAFELMGAAPTAMAIGDCYTAMQQGTIEGLENTFTTLYGLAFHEVAKYVTLTKHVKMPSQWICSQTWWDTLTADQQTILMEAGDEAGLMNNDLQMNGTEDIMSKLEETGVEIIDLSDTERAKFAASVAPLYEDPTITAGWRHDLLGYIQNLTK
ncbi:C4-dicarboxylate TRAP transporter substrate-binding protein [Oscillibacter sp.]|uniref:C4-dicarboxylate TRAP transporter substrate-binding protein n=1 Tax=Oscillibacter sp. TaxID=1945593 RepID=UPI00260890A4|nr:C4-dicarboxylate TRAP transporter substrate-binding protein [Oscillibacter sp.]MDD3347982.1 C4-dicarboxylate TRAP transporter substrate-binding protein [Oscillibacter sp.]